MLLRITFSCEIKLYSARVTMEEDYCHLNTYFNTILLYFMKKKILFTSVYVANERVNLMEKNNFMQL